MYHRYFGLQEEPFSIAVNPKYLFMSARHRDALAHLLYGVGSGGGFILLTGEVGTGKTTINRCLLEQLPAETDIAIILNPALNADELLATVCDELGIDYDSDDYTLKTLTDRLHEFLLENHRKGRNTVLLIDEAQHLQFDVLEQIRLLTNLETNTRKLLQIILVGQPELAVILAKPELRQLNQRITARYELRPLNLTETRAYIRHRLQVAGLPANQELFPDRVVAAIHRITRGIPRLINVLCDRMLLGTYGQNKTSVDMPMLRQAAAEVMGPTPDTAPGAGRWLIAAALALVALALAYWQFAAPLMTTQALALKAPTAQVIAPVLVPEPALRASSKIAWYGQSGQALLALASFMGVPDMAAKDVCIRLEVRGWRCEEQRVQSWNELLDVNRPAVLSLVTAERFAAFAVLVGVSGERAFLLLDGKEIETSLPELGALWSGEFVFLWQPPADYEGPISRGDAGPMVAWLAWEFARLDGQPQPLAENSFNAELDTRVRLFQRQFNLADDGVVGLKTLLKLSQVRGTARPLSRAAVTVAEAGSR